MKQYIIKIGKDDTIESLDPDFQRFMQSKSLQWDLNMLAGTKTYYGKKLILVLLDAELAEIKDVLKNGYHVTDENGNTITKQTGVNWSVVASEDEKIDQTLLLDYFLPEKIYNSETNDFDDVEITDLTNKIQTYAGHDWIY